MATFLVAYGTIEGQTAKVAERVGTVLRDRGHEATVVAVEDAPSEIADVDAVLLGSSIHTGTQKASVQSFVTDHRETLADRPTGFFQVSLSSATDDEDKRAEAAAYVDSFIEETGWEPDRIGLFGGALRYSEYGFLKRLLMKRIAREATGDVDTSRDYEYTDWAEVDAFTNDFASFVEGRLGVAPPAEASGE